MRFGQSVFQSVLERLDVEDAATQQLTVNVLADMGGRRGTPTTTLVDSGPCDWINPGAGCQ